MEFRITISPDPSRIVNKAQKRSYLACTSKEQYCILKHSINSAIELFQAEYQMEVDVKTKVYLELNSSGMMHAHGTIEFIGGEATDKEYKTFFQRMILRFLGREYIKGKVETYLQACCDMQNAPWQRMEINEKKYDSWLQYCLKDQSESWMKRFPPIEVNSLVRQQYAENYLELAQTTQEQKKALEKISRILKKM